MPNLIIEFLLSGIFIIFTIIQSKQTFKKSNPRPIQKDKKEWKGGNKELIEFKKYEYERNFWYITLVFGFTSLLFGIFLTLYNLIIGIIGFFPWVVLILCSLYAPSRFILFTIPKVNNQAIRNIRFLLENEK